jgi:hypothetical protein
MWIAANPHSPNPFGFMFAGRTRSPACPLKLTYSVAPSALSFIPRNHRVEEALAAPYDPPADECGYRTFCGT